MTRNRLRFEKWKRLGNNRHKVRLVRLLNTSFWCWMSLKGPAYLILHLKWKPLRSCPLMWQLRRARLCVCVCLCVRVWVRNREKEKKVSIHVTVYVRVRVCLGVRVCVWQCDRDRKKTKRAPHIHWHCWKKARLCARSLEVPEQLWIEKIAQQNKRVPLFCCLFVPSIIKTVFSGRLVDVGGGRVAENEPRGRWPVRCSFRAKPRKGLWKALHIRGHRSHVFKSLLALTPSMQLFLSLSLSLILPLSFSESSLSLFASPAQQQPSVSRCLISKLSFYFSSFSSSYGFFLDNDTFLLETPFSLKQITFVCHPNVWKEAFEISILSSIFLACIE